MDIKGLEKLFDLKLQNLHCKLDNILEQTTKTNGRIEILEKETIVVRLLSKYPKSLIGIIIVIIASLNMNKLKELVQIIF